MYIYKYIYIYKPYIILISLKTSFKRLSAPSQSDHKQMENFNGSSLSLQPKCLHPSNLIRLKIEDLQFENNITIVNK